jgi:RNA polymerase sigma-70 factor, ECF subfamily
VQVDLESSEASQGTLGDVLYGTNEKPLVSEQEWAALVRAIAAGDEVALHALYERAHRAVYTFMVRMTGNRETAEELTVDVFHDVWRRAAQYDPANGTVLGWIMNQARSRGIDRLRFDQRKKRVAPSAEEPAQLTAAADPHDLLAFKQQSEMLRGALGSLTHDERQAIEAAFFSELTYAEVAARLDVPLGTIKTRIRSGLQKLRKVLAGETTR